MDGARELFAPGGDPEWTHLRTQFAKLSKTAPHERAGWASSYPTHAKEKSRMDGARELFAPGRDPEWVHLRTQLADARKSAPDERAGWASSC